MTAATAATSGKLRPGPLVTPAESGSFAPAKTPTSVVAPGARPSFTTSAARASEKLSGQSHSTVAELQEAYRLIAGGATAITPQMLSEAMRSVGQHPSDEEVVALIRAVNQRGDGNITFPEFAALLGLKIDLGEIEGMRAAFIALDKTMSGTVTTAQFSELFATMGDVSSPEEVEEMLQFADPRGTGRIDYNMFLATIAYRLQ